MITEDYTSYEVAKLLKEKGFDEICSHEWGVPDIDGGYILQKWSIYNGEIRNSELINDAYACPTHQMAMKWLREVHKVHISIYPFNRELPVTDEFYYTCDIATSKLSSKEGHLRGVWKTYEEATEAAIKYTLENLI